MEIKTIRLQEKIGGGYSSKMFTFSDAKREYWESVMTEFFSNNLNLLSPSELKYFKEDILLF